MTSKVPFGLKDGRLFYVSQVATGDACGCVCPDPACGRPLTARNNDFPGRVRAPYFCHKSVGPACSGRESALHLMGKQVLGAASRLNLPRWSALNGELAFEALPAVLPPGSVQEVHLKEGQMRPDLDVMAVVGRQVLQHLYVEIRVSHAVDWAKRERVIAQGYDMIEIDISGVTDEELLDEVTFSAHVLDRLDNRQWIHIGNAAFLASMTKKTIYKVQQPRTREKRVPTRSGGELIFQEQELLCHLWEGGAPTPHYGELANAVRPDGVRVDSFGNTLPYAAGLYIRGEAIRHHPYDSSRFKTQLKPIIQDTRLNAQKSLL